MYTCIYNAVFLIGLTHFLFHVTNVAIYLTNLHSNYNGYSIAINGSAVAQVWGKFEAKSNLKG